MAELVTGLFAAAGTAATAVSGAVSTAAGAASSLGGFLASSGALAGLSGVTGLLSIAARNKATAEAKAASFDKAAEAEMDASAEGIAGQSRAVQLRQSLVAAMAERDIAAAAGGLDIGWGSPVVAREQASADAERALSLDSLETQNRQSRLRQRSAGYVRAGRAAASGGFLQNLASGVNLATDMAQRGAVPKKAA